MQIFPHGNIELSLSYIVHYGLEKKVHEAEAIYKRF